MRPIASTTLDTDPAKMVSAVFGGPTSILVLLMVLHGPIATNILNVYSAALAALSVGFRFSRTTLATDRRRRRLSRHDVLHLRTFVRQGLRQLDDQSAALDEPVGRRRTGRLLHQAKGQIDVAELYRSPEASAYGDINWAGIIAFLRARCGLVGGRRPGGALQGPISINFLGGADLSWLVGIGIAGVVYLVLSKRVTATSSIAATSARG